MLLKPFMLHAPSNLPEACDLHAQLKDSRILAGGTLLINTLKVLKRKNLKTPSHIISLRRVPEMRGIQSNGKTLTIGAMVTISELLVSPLLNGLHQVIKTACQNLGTTPLRNMATVGGNLACRYPWTELPAVMVALGAQFHLASASGKEIISAEDYFAKAAHTHKILTRVTIKNAPDAKAAYVRISRSATVDLPLLAICVQATFARGLLKNTRFVVNNTLALARRDGRLENFLDGKKLDLALIAAVGSNTTPDIYKTPDEYRAHMFGVAIKSAIATLPSS